MSNIITIGYTTEGPTDKRFLESVIKRTFEEVAFMCTTLIEVFDPIYIPAPHSMPFVDRIRVISNQAFKMGVNVLCIHCDADGPNDANVRSHKITPAIDDIIQQGDDYCKNLVAIIPVHMSEAWILADKPLFKREIGTTKSDVELKIARHPEAFADPKSAIEEALRISQEHLQNRRQRIHIGELYQPLGQQIPIDCLERLNSFSIFIDEVRRAYRFLNYLH